VAAIAPPGPSVRRSSNAPAVFSPPLDALRDQATYIAQQAKDARNRKRHLPASESAPDSGSDRSSANGDRFRFIGPIYNGAQSSLGGASSSRAARSSNRQSSARVRFDGYEATSPVALAHADNPGIALDSEQRTSGGGVHLRFSTSAVRFVAAMTDGDDDETDMRCASTAPAGRDALASSVAKCVVPLPVPAGPARRTRGTPDPADEICQWCLGRGHSVKTCKELLEYRRDEVSVVFSKVLELLNIKRLNQLLNGTPLSFVCRLLLGSVDSGWECFGCPQPFTARS
jgi:hypothetical protein